MKSFYFLFSFLWSRDSKYLFAIRFDVYKKMFKDESWKEKKIQPSAIIISLSSNATCARWNWAKKTNFAWSITKRSMSSRTLWFWRILKKCFVVLSLKKETSLRQTFIGVGSSDCWTLSRSSEVVGSINDELDCEWSRDNDRLDSFFSFSVVGRCLKSNQWKFIFVVHPKRDENKTAKHVDLFVSRREENVNLSGYRISNEQFQWKRCFCFKNNSSVTRRKFQLTNDNKCPTAVWESFCTGSSYKCNGDGPYDRGNNERHWSNRFENLDSTERKKSRNSSFIYWIFTVEDASRFSAFVSFCDWSWKSNKISWKKVRYLINSRFPHRLFHLKDFQLKKNFDDFHRFISVSTDFDPIALKRLIVVLANVYKGKKNRIFKGKTVFLQFTIDSIDLLHVKLENCILVLHRRNNDDLEVLTKCEQWNNVDRLLHNEESFVSLPVSSEIKFISSSLNFKTFHRRKIETMSIAASLIHWNLPNKRSTFIFVFLNEMKRKSPGFNQRTKVISSVVTRSQIKIIEKSRRMFSNDFKKIFFGKRNLNNDESSCYSIAQMMEQKSTVVFLNGLSIIILRNFNICQQLLKILSQQMIYGPVAFRSRATCVRLIWLRNDRLGEIHVKKYFYRLSWPIFQERWSKHNFLHDRIKRF